LFSSEIEQNEQLHLSSDDQEVHQYQQNQQLPLSSDG
jgi:hypothetical protein